MKTAIGLAAALLLAVVPIMEATAQEATPEKAVEKCIKALVDLDMDRMLTCFSIRNFVDRSDFKAIASWVKAVTLPITLLPNDYPAYRKINYLLRQAQVATELERALVVLSADEFDFGRSIIISKPGEIDRIAADLDPAAIRGAKLVKMADAVEKEYSERARDLFKRQAKLSGAEDLVERIVLVQMGKRFFVIPFRLARYPDGWYIETLQSYISGLSGLQETTVADFDSRIF